MGGRGSASGLSGTLRNRLAAYENRIRSDQVETAVVFDAKGNVLIDKSDGNENQVAFDSSDLPQLHDAILTHNHPNGSTFSDDDLNLAYTCGVRILRACHENGFYQIERQFKIGEDVPYHYEDFGYDYDRAVAQYQATTVDQVWFSSAQTYEDAERCNTMLNDYRRDWLRQNAARYGWKYTDGGK